MKAFFATLIVFVFSFPGTPVQNTRTNAPITYYHGLAVQISPEKAEYQPGEPIVLHVEFRNESVTNIRVGRTAVTGGGAPFRLSVRIEDSTGRVVLEPVRDPVELPCVDLREADVNHPTVWTEIAPNSRYSTTVTVRMTALKTAQHGRYKIQARYRSYGVLTGGHCVDFGPTAVSNDSRHNSAGTEWRGEVDTNVAWITIVSPTEVPR